VSKFVFDNSLPEGVTRIIHEGDEQVSF